MSILTQARVRELFDYDPSRGTLTRLSARGNRAAGSSAGTPNWSGHLYVEIDRRTYAVHRVVWLYLYGAWPSSQIDHINGKRDDNCIANLRLATPSENQCNSKRRSDNKSGLKGVCFRKDNGRWAAQITFDGQQRHLGLFATREEAYAARLAAVEKFHGEFAAHRCRPAGA